MARDPRSHSKVEYGKRLYALRTDRGLTQKSLARKVGVSYNTIGNIEKGHTFPQPLVRQRIAKFFSTDEWLFQSAPPGAVGPQKKPGHFVIPFDIHEGTQLFDIIHGPPGITILVNPETVPLAHRKIALEMAEELQRRLKENKGKD